jgi:glycosyltransferase involved in cell wall biosynthesis
MKYGFLIESLSVATGGPSRVAGIIATELAGRGHSVIIATLKENEELVTVSEQVELRFLAPAASVFPNLPQIIKAIRNLAEEVDVLIVSGIWGPVDGLALKLANIRGTPVYIRICGMLEDYILRRNAWKKKLARGLYVNRNLRAATGLLVNTAIEKDHVSALGMKNEIHVIPNGVVLPKPDERIEREVAAEYLGADSLTKNRILLYLSRIHPKKGLHLFLGAFAVFVAAHPEWRLVVAGDFFNSAYEELIRKRIEELNLGSSVIFTGEVAGKAKTAAFSIADAFVLPSESEGFSNAVVEALSWGLPALITSGCNFPEVEMGGAGRVVSYDEKALLEGLENLLAKPEKLTVMGKNAKKLAEEKYQLCEIVDLYERLATVAL